MKNEPIEVVKRWQAGEVFSVEALQANAEAAAAVYDAAEDWTDARLSMVARAAWGASHAAARAAGLAADAANATADTTKWVTRYEELTK